MSAHFLFATGAISSPTHILRESERELFECSVSFGSYARMLGLSENQQRVRVHAVLLPHLWAKAVWHASCKSPLCDPRIPVGVAGITKPLETPAGRIGQDS